MCTASRIQQFHCIMSSVMTPLLCKKLARMLEWWPSFPNMQMPGTIPLKLSQPMHTVVQLQGATHGSSDLLSWTVWDGKGERCAGSFLWNAMCTKLREKGRRQPHSLSGNDSCPVFSASTIQTTAMWTLKLPNQKLLRHSPILHSKPAAESIWCWTCKVFIWTKRNDGNHTSFSLTLRLFQWKGHLDQVIWERKGCEPSFDLTVVVQLAKSWGWTRMHGRKAKGLHERTDLKPCYE